MAKKKKERASTKPFRKLTRLNGIKYLQGFHLPLNFQIKKLIGLVDKYRHFYSLTILSRGSTV